MKPSKWRELDEGELRERAQALRQEIFNLRFQLSQGMAKNPLRIRTARRDLARALTTLRERELRKGSAK
jgi:large subunit ribosomal protein L29